MLLELDITGKGQVVEELKVLIEPTGKGLSWLQKLSMGELGIQHCYCRFNQGTVKKFDAMTNYISGSQVIGEKNWYDVCARDHHTSVKDKKAELVKRCYCTI